MVEFRKRLPLELIAAILEASIPKEDAGKDNDHDDSDGELPAGHDETKETVKETSKGVVNKGALIMDATCCPADIAFPQDFQLLNHARELLEKTLRTICDEHGCSNYI